MATDNVYIDASVRLESDSYISNNTHILGNTHIESGCYIGPYNIIENSIIGSCSKINSFSVLKNVQAAKNCTIGPFAHMQNTTIGESCIIGNFVETKRSSMGKNTKAKHHCYLGDAQIGSQVNIGAGTITCNHNGTKKSETIISDHAYIGANNSLVAPLSIGSRAFTGAGSVITEDVPDGLLALGRARQINKQYR